MFVSFFEKKPKIHIIIHQSGVQSSLQDVTSLYDGWIRMEYPMGLVGKVVGVKAVKGRRDDKKEKKAEAEAAKAEEKK